MIMNDFYKQQIEMLKAKVIAHAKLGNELKVAMLEKEITNYEKALGIKKVKGVDSYLTGDL